MVQSVKCLTLDISSDHGLAICVFEPHVGLYADGAAPPWDSLSFSLSLPLPLSLKINKLLKNDRWIQLEDTAQPACGSPDSWHI